MVLISSYNNGDDLYHLNRAGGMVEVIFSGIVLVSSIDRFLYRILVVLKVNQILPQRPQTATFGRHEHLEHAHRCFAYTICSLGWYPTISTNLLPSFSHPELLSLLGHGNSNTFRLLSQQILASRTLQQRFIDDLISSLCHNVPQFHHH